MNFILRHCISIFAAAALAFVFAANSRAQSAAADMANYGAPYAGPKRILLISSFELSHNWSFETLSAVREELAQNHPSAEFDYAELDGSQTSRKKEFGAYKSGIKNGNYDVIVCLLDDAADMLVENAAIIPDKTPVVVCTNRDALLKVKQAIPNSTGVYFENDISKTVDLALKIAEDARNILILHNGRDSGHRVLTMPDPSQKKFSGKKVEIIGGFENRENEIYIKLEQLPAGSIVAMCCFDDSSGEARAKRKVFFENVLRISRSPVFTMNEKCIGRGAVGGYVNVGKINGKALGALTERVLKNGSARDVTPVYQSGCAMIDMEAAERFSLKIPQLPADTVYLNYASMPWYRYPWYDTGLAILGLICVALFANCIRKTIILYKLRLLIKEFPVSAKVIALDGRIISGHDTHTSFEAAKNLKEIGAKEDRAYKRAFRELIATKAKSVKFEFDSSALCGRRFEVLVKKLPDRIYGKNVFIALSEDVTDRHAAWRNLDTTLEREKVYRIALQMIAQDKTPDEIISWLMESVFKWLKADRLVQFSFNYKSLTASKIREVTNYNSLEDDGGKINTESKLHKALENDEFVIYDCDNPNSASDADGAMSIIKKFGIKTNIMLGITSAGKLDGMIVADYIKQKRKVTEPDMSAMANLAKIIRIADARKQMSDRQKAAETERKLILDSMDIPVLLFDSECRFISANAAAASFAGLRPEDVIVCSQVCDVKGCEPGKSTCILDTVRETRKPAAHVAQYGDKKFKMTYTPVFGRDSQIVNFVVTGADVTEIEDGKAELQKAADSEKRIGEALSAALRSEEEAVKAKSVFLATITHELRTPLNSIIGYSELLLDSKLPQAEREDALKDINMSSKSLLTLVNDVLDMSMLDSGKMQITPTPIEIETFIKNVSHTFMLSVRDKGLKFETRIQPFIPRLMLDATRLRQVLVNVISNAVKYTSEGSITLDVKYVNSTLAIEISDTGIGMTPKFLENIFNPFERDYSQKIRGNNVYEGTGLGLSISKKLITKMGGSIEVKSGIGTGSTFKIALSNVAVATAEDEPAISEGPPPSETEFSSIAPVVVVDDVAINLKVAAAILRKLGAKCVLCESGMKTLETIKEIHPSMILTDLWMPEMDGAELAAKIRTMYEMQNVPIVAVTGDLEHQFEKNAFDDTIFKPITIESMRALLQKHLRPSGNRK